MNQSSHNDKDDDDDDNEENEENSESDFDDHRQSNGRFLLTELGENAYLSSQNSRESSDEEDELKFKIDVNNEDELFMVRRSRRSKHKPPSERMLNFNDIENEKDYDTDLEGNKSINWL